MDKFTARNDATVEQFSKSLDVQMRGASIWLEPWAVDALREFFQAEGDEELGRWRYSPNRALVCYPVSSQDAILIVNEKFGEAVTYTRAESLGDGWAVNAARAYFEAHPMRNPWEDATPGEVWEIVRDGIGQGIYLRAHHEWRAIWPFSWSTSPASSLDRVTSARRIYPEVSDAVD